MKTFLIRETESLTPGGGRRVERTYRGDELPPPIPGYKRSVRIEHGPGVVPFLLVVDEDRDPTAIAN